MPYLEALGQSSVITLLYDHGHHHFTTDQTQPQSLMVWVRLPGLPEGMYTNNFLRYIGSAIGTVAKIDRNTTDNTRGQFVRLVIYVDLGKLLVSKVKIDGKIQLVKYK